MKFVHLPLLASNVPQVDYKFQNYNSHSMSVSLIHCMTCTG